MAFDHFHTSLLWFLAELKANNIRDWFQANKFGFEAQVQQVPLEFIEALGPHIESISRRMAAIATKSGGSQMRIYRDTRFSKNKRPYHEYISAHFHHRRGRTFQPLVSTFGCRQRPCCWRSEQTASARCGTVPKGD